MNVNEIPVIKTLREKGIPWKTLIGIAAGTGLGFLYYTFVGCAGGTCPITSNPWSSMIYGGVLGLLFTRM